jgi:hypothetical protein
MALWTFRVEIADRPGQLAALTAAVASCECNILGLDVQALDGDRVTDELLVDVPDSVPVEHVERAVRDTGADVVTLLPADPHDLIDAQARCLELGRRLVHRHAVRDRVLEAALVELVGADGAWVLSPAHVTMSELALRAVAAGEPLMARERTALAPTLADEEAPWLLVVPPFEGKDQVTMLGRARSGFTASEVARVQALLRLDAALGAHAEEPAEPGRF